MQPESLIEIITLLNSTDVGKNLFKLWNKLNEKYKKYPELSNIIKLIKIVDKCNDYYEISIKDLHIRVEKFGNDNDLTSYASYKLKDSEWIHISDYNELFALDDDDVKNMYDVFNFKETSMELYTSMFEDLIYAMIDS